MICARAKGDKVKPPPLVKHYQTSPPAFLYSGSLNREVDFTFFHIYQQGPFIIQVITENHTSG